MSLQLSIYLLIAGLAGAAPSARVRELQDGIHERIRGFRNLEFHYTVDGTFWSPPGSEPDRQTTAQQRAIVNPSPRGIRSRDTFRILAAEGPENRPWRAWQTEIERDGAWIMDAFVTYDGQQTSVFQRRAAKDEKNYHLAGIFPFEATADFDNNVFERFLSTDLNGLREDDDPGWHLSDGIDNHWTLAGTVEFGGQNAYVLHGRKSDVEHLAHVLGDPHYLMVHRRITSREFPEAEPLVKWDVHSLVEIDGRLYPAAGTWTQSPAPGSARIEYSFRVTSARPIEESVKANWRPAWPSGTAIRDAVRNENVTIPHAPGEREQIESERAQKTGHPPEARRVSVLIGLNVAVLVIAAICWAVIRLRSSQKEISRHP